MMATNTNAQNAIIELDANSVTVDKLIREIEKQTDYLVVYSNREVNTSRTVNLKKQSDKVSEYLNQAFQGTDIGYDFEKNYIVLSKKAEETASILTNLAQTVQQQGKTVKGVVTDTKGEPIIGATIVLKGDATRGTVTDIDGNYIIPNLPEDAVLEISYVGMQTQNILTEGKTTINITLTEDVGLLEEVVVVGYGTQKKVNLTGAISTVNFEKEAMSRPATSVASALAGMSAGLQIRTTSSNPGSESNSILIRGVGTLNSTSPLVIVDGIQSSLDYVNANDIATISVLKDAASSAIYGNRAANGVILITTKRGDQGKVNVNYSTKFSFNSPMNRLEFVNDYADYMEYMNESLENLGQASNFQQSTIDTWRAAKKNPNALAESGYPNYVAYANTDWQEYMYKNQASQEHNVSLRGSTGKSNFMTSINYLDNPGLIENTAANRYSMRSNLDIQATDWLKVGNQTYGYVTNKEPGNFSTAVEYMYLSTPGQYPRYDGVYGYPAATEESATANNSLYVVNGGAGFNRTSRIKTAFYAQIDFLKDFSFMSLVNYGRYWYDAQSKSEIPQRTRVNFATGVLSSPATLPENLSTSFSANGQWDYTIQETLNWNHLFANRHDVSAVLGYEEMYSYSYDQAASKKGLIDASIWAPSTATEMTSISGSASDYSSRSYFSRVNYALDSKYLLEANIRYDGSSRFSKEKRWGFFPSFSAGWRLSEESFLKDTNIFDNLKLRASHGTLGNNSIGNYDYQSTYASKKYTFGQALASGLAASAFANHALMWESTTITNLGIDMATLANKLTAEIDFYQKRTEGILYRPSVYMTAGTQTAPLQNIAEVTNKGVEFTIGWRGQINDFQYSVSSNIAYNHNEVSKYKGALKEGWVTDDSGNKVYQSNLGDVSTGGTNRVLEDHKINEYYMLKPYSGSGTYFNGDNTVNINGGPKDGMIRTEKDMEWLQAMVAAGHSFYPKQAIGKASLWYGDYIYADLNGDGVYGNTYDNHFTGKSSTPKYTFGIQGNASWKDFDFSMNWAGAAGFDLYWKSVGLNSTGTRIGYNMLASLANDHYFYNPDDPSDKRTNLTSKNARLTANENNNQQGATSTLWLYKGDYLKLKNLTFGYTLPAKWSNKILTENIRLFFSAENLFTITKYPGQDPEMGAGMGYVTMRQCALGANISF